MRSDVRDIQREPHRTWNSKWRLIKASGTIGVECMCIQARAKTDDARKAKCSRGSVRIVAGFAHRAAVRRSGGLLLEACSP